MGIVGYTGKVSISKKERLFMMLLGIIIIVPSNIILKRETCGLSAVDTPGLPALRASSPGSVNGTAEE